MKPETTPRWVEILIGGGRAKLVIFYLAPTEEG